MKPWTEARNNKCMKYHSKLTYQLSFWNVSRKVDYHAGGKWFIHGPKRRKENQLLSLKHPWYIVDTRAKMTSSNGNIFRITSSSWKRVHRSSMNSTHKGRRRGALMFSLICSWRNGWTNHQEAGDLRRHRAHSWRQCNARWTWTEEFRFKWLYQPIVVKWRHLATWVCVSSASKNGLMPTCTRTLQRPMLACHQPAPDGGFAGNDTKYASPTFVSKVSL